MKQRAVADYSEAIRPCAPVGDYTTRNMLEVPAGRGEQMDWLETYLTTIAQIGRQHYLAQQIHNGVPQRSLVTTNG